MEPSPGQKCKGEENTSGEYPSRILERNGRLDLPCPAGKRQKGHGGKSVDCVNSERNEQENEQKEVRKWR